MIKMDFLCFSALPHPMQRNLMVSKKEWYEMDARKDCPGANLEPYFWFPFTSMTPYIGPVAHTHFLRATLLGIVCKANDCKLNNKMYIRYTAEYWHKSLIFFV